MHQITTFAHPRFWVKLKKYFSFGLSLKNISVNCVPFQIYGMELVLKII